MICPVSHGHWKVTLEINIKSQTGPLSLIPKCPLWHPFISLWAGSMESTDLRNKAHILICLWASSSSSLSLSFVFCTVSCWLLRVFPAQSPKSLRLHCPHFSSQEVQWEPSQAELPFWQEFPSWASASLWKTFSASPGRHLQPHRKASELRKMQAKKKC